MKLSILADSYVKACRRDAIGVDTTLELNRKTASLRGGAIALLLLVCCPQTCFTQITNIGHALTFDGTINAAVITSGFQGFPSTNITVEFWARSTNTSKAGSLFSYGAGGDANNFLIYNHQNISIWINNLSSVPTGVSLTDGLWHHIAVTWSTSGALQIFKDGALAFSTNHQAGVVLGNNGTLVFGQDQDLIGGGFDPAQAFLGDLDEVRIWSVVRTPSEISQNFTNLLTGGEPGLAGYYRFNEGFGTTTMDATSLGHNATLGTGVHWLALAPYNPDTALNLTNGFVNVPHSDALNAYPLTVAAWVRTTSAQPLDVMVSKLGDIQGEPNGYQLFLENGVLKAFYFLNVTYRVDFRLAGPSAGLINDGQWHYVAFAVDASGGKLFVDGALRATRAWQGIAGSVTTTNDLTFGSLGANGFPGQLDELALWNTALNSSSIQTFMGRRLSGTEPNLLALYHFDEESGLLAYDSSGNGNTGTLQYGAGFGPSGAVIQGLAELRGRVTEGSSGAANIPMTALLPPVYAPSLLSIPDNNTVTSTNIVTRPGTIGSMKVNVNITHPYRGDLELTLIHPDGTEVRLKDADDTDAEQDVVTSYPQPSSAVGSLAVFNGKPLAGTWRLRVRDAFPLDNGVLNTWSIQSGPAPTLTDINGSYAFTGLFAGIYTVQPVRNGFIFDPPVRTSPVDWTNVDFSMVSGFISGRVVDNTNGMAGVTISAGPGFTTTTGPDGSYQLAALPPGNKTISASKLGYSFSPPQINGVSLGTTNANFQVIAYPIAGRITDLFSNGVSGVTVAASSSASLAISDNDGNYMISSALPGSVLIVPSKSGVTFSPPSITRSVTSAQANVDFVAIQSPPTITQIKNNVIAKNGSTGPLRFDVNDAETPAARLQLSALSSDPNLVPVDNIIFDGVGVQRTVAVTPATNQFGTAAITVIVTDESGLSTNGTFTVRVNQLPLPGVGIALDFDGINDIASANTNVIENKGTFTVETWASAPSNAGPRTLLSQGNGFTIGLDAGGQIHVGTNWNTGVSFAFGGWHHLAVTREAADTRLYLDGVLRASRGNAIPYPSQGAAFQVGALGNNEFWLGAVDEVRVWREGRTASQIASNQTVRITGLEPNLLGLWHFDERSGATASNSVPGGRHLSVTGATRIQSQVLFDHYVTLQGRNINDVLQGFDADGDPLTWSLVTLPAHGTVTLLSTNTGTFYYTADGLGEDQFTFSVSDPYITSETHVITIQVLPDTNAPVISFLADQTIAEDTVLGPLAFTVSDSERTADFLPVFGHSSNQTLVPDANIVIAGTGTNRTFTILPATNQFGTATISLIVSDGSQQATSSFGLTVTPVNDAPLLSVLTNQVVPRNALNFGQFFTVQDVDTPLASVVLTATSDNPSIASTYGNIPGGDAGVFRTLGGSNAKIAVGSGTTSGTATITVTADDGNIITSRSHIVTVNDPPTIGAIPNQSTFRNFASKPIIITLADVDDPVGNSVLTASSSNPAVVDNSSFSFSGSGANRTLVIRPVGGRIGQTTITLTAGDAWGSSTTTFQFFVEEGLDFDFVELPHAPGTIVSVPNDLNTSLQVVGLSRVPTVPGFELLGNRAVVWNGMQSPPSVSLLVFQGPGNDVKSHATAINGLGQIIGSRLAGTDSQAFLHYNGTFTDLTLSLGGHAFSHAGDIGEAGQIVGIESAVGFGSESSFFLSGGSMIDFGGTVFGGRGELDQFGYGKVQVNRENAAVTANSAGHLILRKQDNSVVDLGTFGGNIAIPTGINDSGDIYGFTRQDASTLGNNKVFIYNYHNQTTNYLQAALLAAGLNPGYITFKLNNWGEMVGTAIGADNSPHAFQYVDGRAYDLQDLRPSSDFRLFQARGINDNGDVVGYGIRPGEPLDSYRAFLLKRRQWTVGRPVKPPLQAVDPVSGRVYRAPSFAALDGTTPEQVTQTTLWSDLEQRFYFLRPVRGRLSWYTTADLLNTNAPVIERIGTANWPAPPQVHVAGAPVGLDPVAAASPYRPVALSYSEALGATLDASTRTFNAPNSGYSVIRYLIAPEAPTGATPDPLTHSNYFEVVRTVLWNDLVFLLDGQPATVGTKVTDPRGAGVVTNSFKSGWTIFPVAPYDGAGADRAYDRATQTGPIIPVNRDNAAMDDDLVVAFYKQNALTTTLWPDLPVRFSISWPSNAEKLVIANRSGSGPLPEAQFPEKRIYVQTSTNLPGYNPNEEHAFLAPTSSGQGVFALRNDLNRSGASECFVLLKYRNPTSGEWQFKVYQPVLTDAAHVFTDSGEAGQEILPPYPLSLLTICSGSTNISGKAFRDYKGKYYAATGPTPSDLNPQVVMHYFYPLQPGFYYDLDGNGTNDLAVGDCVPWNGIPPGTSLSQPVDVTYRIRWPDDAPTLQIGETLLNPKRGLPGIKNWASAQVVFDSLNQDGTNPLANTARLYDPLSARVLRLTNVVGISASYQFPSEITLQTGNGKQIFSGLPYHLRSRLSYDPVNKAISFAGFLDDTVIGEPLLLVNVLSGKERDRIKQLSGEANFRRIIDALYDLTRNPNGVNIAHPGQSPDQGLDIGFTTKYTAYVTNGVPPSGTTTVQDFFGTRPAGNNLGLISTNIALEPFGDVPKALTAGLPVAESHGDFGRALNFAGNGAYVSLPAELFDFPTSGTTNRPFTFECWFKTASAGVILGQQAGTTLDPSGGYVPAIYLGTDGKLRVEMFWGGAGTPITSTNAVNDNKFHHLAVVFDGEKESAYLDGTLVGSIAHVQTAYANTYSYQLGAGYTDGWAFGNGSWLYFNGLLDEVRLWNKARSTNDLLLTRNIPLTGGESGLSAYWRFDETSGLTATDSSVAMHDLALTNLLTRVPSTVPATSSAPRYVVIAENNNAALGSLPVTLHVIQVDAGPFRGDLKTIFPDNVFDERLTLRHSSDFGADPDRLEFEWWYHPDDADFEPTALPTLNPDGSIADAKGWLVYAPALTPNKSGQNTITIGDGGETSLFTLEDNWFISRYRGYNIGGQTNWSDWVGDPSSDTTTRASLAPGWVKRVVEGINPFEARTTDFHNSPANTYSSMLIQAGQRYEGDIALNPSGENLLKIGLIEAYTTVLNRGKGLSIDGLPPVDSDPLNNALLLAASRISDLYVLLGNEALADADDPTIGFFSDEISFGTIATSMFAFQNQLDSLLEEELALLRGRDDSAAGVGARPVYNRLLWNFTGSAGEVAYERTYNIGDVNLDGVINEFDAKILFPQGHGDAWGHYLTALTTYYDLLRHPRFTWIPRTENVLIAGTAVRVDFLDERKFATAAAAKAKAGAEIVDLTYRSKYVDDPEGQYQGYKDTRADRAWGVDEWARRAGQGAYFDWLVGNAILPSTDPNPAHTGIQKIDRQTVLELDDIIAQHQEVRSQMDKADAGLNPLGLAKGSVPFDIDPSLLAQTTGAQSITHFEQIYNRAVDAMNNCVTVWNQANLLSEALRRQQDEVDDFTANVTDQERDYKNRLIEVFGYPYAGDIGAGKIYPSGYDGPDLYHYMYVNTPEISGRTTQPSATYKGLFSPLQTDYGKFGFSFPNDSPLNPAATVNSNDVLTVNYPTVSGDWVFAADASFGQRRAPGELQLAISDLIQEQARLKQALKNYENLVRHIQDSVELVNAQYNLNTNVLGILNEQKNTIVGMNAAIGVMFGVKTALRTVANAVSTLCDAAKEAIPTDLTDFMAPARGLIKGIGVGGSIILNTSADVIEVAENSVNLSKETVPLETEIKIQTATRSYELQQSLKELEQLIREEGVQRLDCYNQAELVKQTLGRYLAAVNSGLRLVNERTVFRQRTAALTQQNRYKDMAFRVFRNEALEKYRAQYDLAARFVFLAATAYDYDLNFLGTDNRSGRDFFTDIIRQRSIGQLVDGIPIAGSSGLADGLGRLRQNFEVLRTRFGLNNPQTETARFSLRKELFRIRDNSDDQWRATLQQAVVPNLWDVPEFRRYCRPFTPESAGAQPGIVIRFPTTVTFGLNFFGFPLGGGDSAYDPSLFTTKINSVGVWFENYNSAGLAIAPRVYLVPAGMDVQRSPTGNTLATREWKIIDQAIPVPFPIGASSLTDPTWIPMNDSLSESFAQIRHFSSFRAYHDAGVYDDTQTTKDSRLIGRSVWNTDWMLIIPGGTFLFDANQGLDTFINSVGDIKLSLQSYSYSGD